jgi:hypothetical protein
LAKKKVVKVQPVEPVIAAKILVKEPPAVPKENVKIVTVQTVNPRKVFLCGQELEFKEHDCRVLRSDKIRSFDEVLRKLTNPLSPVVKILEVKEE